MQECRVPVSCYFYWSVSLDLGIPYYIWARGHLVPLNLLLEFVSSLGQTYKIGIRCNPSKMSLYLALAQHSHIQ